MDQRYVGRTGLCVSSLGLGTMTWGRDTDELEAGEQLRDFLEAGGTLLDTAGSYGAGAAEELIGSMIGRTASRSDLVLCSKAGIRHAGQASRIDSSRGVLLDGLDASLRRLGTDHLDLFLVQSYDPRSQIDETLSALEIALTSGRTRYVGLSNVPSWYAAQAATKLAGRGCELAALEMEYSLLQRGIERDCMPAAAALGMGVLAWSALGRGVLTGKYRHSIPADSRAASPHLAGFVQPYLTTRSAAIVEAVMTAAEGLGRSPLDVSLAWAMSAPGIASAIVGGRTAAQFRTSLAALDLQLPHEIRTVLDEVSAIEFGYPERR